MITIETLQKRLNDLRQQREQAMLTLSAVEGAIQDVLYLIELAKADKVSD